MLASPGWGGGFCCESVYALFARQQLVVIIMLIVRRRVNDFDFVLDSLVPRCLGRTSVINY